MAEIGKTSHVKSSAPPPKVDTPPPAKVRTPSVQVATPGISADKTKPRPPAKLPVLKVPTDSGPPKRAADMQLDKGVVYGDAARGNPKLEKVETSASSAKGAGGLGSAYPNATVAHTHRFDPNPFHTVEKLSPGCSVQADEREHPEVLYVRGTDGKIYEYKAKIGDLCVGEDKTLRVLRRGPGADGKLYWDEVKHTSDRGGHFLGSTLVDPKEFLARPDQVKPEGGTPVDKEGRPVDSVHFDKAKLIWTDKAGNEVNWKFSESDRDDLEAALKLR